MASIIETAAATAVERESSTYSFETMGLHPELLRGIIKVGHERPSFIQNSTIIPIMQGKDIIVKSPSGRGKTTAILISALQRIEISIKSCQVLILVPTREMVMGMLAGITQLGEFLGVSVHGFIGGTNIREDVKVSRAGVQIALCTPGRVYDLIRRRVFDTSTLKLFMVDEANILFTRDFKNQIFDLHKTLPDHVQCAIFSDELTTDQIDGIRSVVKDPLQVFKEAESEFSCTKQFFFKADTSMQKFSFLRDLFERAAITQTIIYCNDFRSATWLTNNLRTLDFPVECIHCNTSKEIRETTVENFRAGLFRYLVLTDVLVYRGLNIHEVPLVINYDFPSNREYYLSRARRLGRRRRKGVIMNLILEADSERMRDVETFYDTKIEAVSSDLENIL